MEQALRLLEIKNLLEGKEKQNLSTHASQSVQGVRRRPEQRLGHRQTFAVDSDRILHSKTYTRYIDKTQVFYMIENDHITHRVLHVQLVAKIARTIGRFLSLNEDLIEAIALGHDLGHPPFGHDGEAILSELCLKHGLEHFLHNVQSVRFLEKIEKGGKGLNLTLQTLDGILCHDGEVHMGRLQPAGDKSFADLDSEMAAKSKDPSLSLAPMTMEGCVVRLADTIGYIGRDIEDAIQLGLIDRRQIPQQCRAVLGDSNGTIVYTLVTDLICGSHGQPYTSFSPAVSEALALLKEFNYRHIYLNPYIKQDLDAITSCYHTLFETCLTELESESPGITGITEYWQDLEEGAEPPANKAEVVRDFIAGMTDDYFLGQAQAIGCTTPKKK